MGKKREIRSIELEGDDDRFIHVVWSRSGKRAIVTVGKDWPGANQIELTLEVAAQLAAFLASGPEPD